MSTDFEACYKSEDTPWDHGTVDENLIQIINGHAITSGSALDIGCGTGENALWLVEHGFTVTACDLAPTAINRAKAKAEERNLTASFIVKNILTDPIPGAPFDLVFDRGCLHGMSAEKERGEFVTKVAELLIDGGRWLTLIGNADEPERELGPPRLTATELLTATESRFELLSLQSSFFGSNQENPPRCWVGLFHKR